MIGETISHYRIVEQLGEGGMGVVYKAEDERLGRTVALKFLPQHMTRNPEACQRFEREARAVSALEHPNICTIHDIDETEDGQTFIVMACYERQSLRERLRPGPVSIEEAVRIAQQTARGLACAHEAGVIHRDVKPGNIMVSDKGDVRIVDFGLARLADQTSLTRTGRIVGTAAYMSPEQTRGEKADHRTDIWGLGVVLYEMVTGQRPFRGETEQAALYSVVNETPAPVGSLRPGVPLVLEEVIRRAMAKDPAKRYQSARAMYDDLTALRREIESTVDARTTTLAYRVVRRRAARTIVVTAAVAAAASIVAWYVIRDRDSGAPILGQPHRLTSLDGWEGDTAISPDGDQVAYSSNESGNLDVYVMSTQGGPAVRVTSNAYDECQPAWYPDGRNLAFVSDRGGTLSIWKTSPFGGGATLLVRNGRGPSISRDGRIAYSKMMPSHVLRIAAAPADDPSQETILTAEDESRTNHRDPAWSPDGRRICYSTGNDLWMVPSRGGTPQPLTVGGSRDREPEWSSDGRHVYFHSFREGTFGLWRVASNGGEPERWLLGDYSCPSISRDGARLACTKGSSTYRILLRDLDTGEECAFSGLADAHEAAIAPDNRSIVFCGPIWGSEAELGRQSLVAGKPAGEPTRLTDQPGNASHPSISPDGMWIAYDRNVDGNYDIWIVPAAGGEPIRFTEHPDADMHAAWSPDGSMLAFASERADPCDIWVAGVRNGRRVDEPRRLTSGERLDYAPAWSPDGTLIAFAARDWLAWDVWLIPSDGSRQERRVTRGLGSIRVKWDPATGALLASGPGEGDRTVLWSVSLDDGATTPVDPLIEFNRSNQTGLFDVSSDGRLILWTQEETRADVWVMLAEDRI